MSVGGGLESEPASPATLRLRPTHAVLTHSNCVPPGIPLGILLWNRPGVFFLTQEICILLFLSQSRDCRRAI